jgi:hypothetical protein
VIRKTLTSSLSFIDFTALYKTNDDLFTFYMSGNEGDSEVIKPVIDFVNKAFELRFPPKS